MSLPCGKGWALRFIALADGRHQNLAVLLPGDLCTCALFQEKFPFGQKIGTAKELTVHGTARLPKRLS
jgi:hypothetical protein